MQDAGHNKLSKYDLARHESPSSSVVRAPDPCYARSWVRFPSGTQNFSLSHARDKLNIPSLATAFCSLKFTIYLSSLSHTVLSTLLILAVCRTRVTTNSVNMTLARHESPSSSVVRAPDRCYGRSWVRFPSGTQNFSLSHARDKLNIPSFSRIKMLINSFSQDLIYATSAAKENLLNSKHILLVVWGENSDWKIM